MNQQRTKGGRVQPRATFRQSSSNTKRAERSPAWDHPCLVSGTSAAARTRTPGVQKAASCHIQRGNSQGFVNQQLETANNSGCQKRHSNLFPFCRLSWPHFPVPRKGLHGCRELFGGSKFFGLDTSRASPKERLAGRVWTRRGREQGRALRLRNFESWR